MFKSLLPFGVGLALVIGSTCVHGVITDRWGAPPDLPAAAAKLDNIPEVIGDWHSEPVEISATELQAAEAVGHFARSYRNDRTQEEIQVLIVCGAHGPIAVHPPTICFTGAGFVQTKPEERQTVDLGKESNVFWQTVFTKTSPEGFQLSMQTYWAWTVDGACQAPDNPRVEFASSGHLYKIYVTRVLRPHETSENPKKDAPCKEFLKLFLPKFQAALSKPQSS